MGISTLFVSVKKYNVNLYTNKHLRLPPWHKLYDIFL